MSKRLGRPWGWPKVDFFPINEKPGRSKDGSILTVYWYDHGQPDIFSFIFDETLDEKVHVAIDANILFDLQDKDSRNKDDSRALLADWLQDEIELCVTQEIYNEIGRNDDPCLREKSRKFANTFKNIPFRKVSDQGKQEIIDKLFLNAKSEQDESDKRQIEMAIAANIEYFITHDENLLKKSNLFRAHLGLSIWSPSELILHIDSLRRSGKYYPTRLAGTNIEFSNMDSLQIPKVVETFMWPSQEKKRTFSKQLQLRFKY